MINELLVHNFKLFKEPVKIPLTSVNLLTGINGRGKSSALQVFLLLSQSALENRATINVLLNGTNVRLGSFDDVKNKDTSSSEKVHFGFQYDDFRIDYYLHNSQLDATELFIEKIIATAKIHQKEFAVDLTRKGSLYELVIQNSQGKTNTVTSSLFDLFLSEAAVVQINDNSECEYLRKRINLINIHYVSADRIGPKNYYENKSFGQFISVGALAENAVNLLYQKGSDKVSDEILEGYCRLFGENKDELSITIEENVNYWMGKIFQGAKIRVESIKGEDLIKLRINSDSSGSYFKPTNVGYGFSYSFPIIVAGLVAKRGEILIVENPEAHLHPYAQSILAKFLALVSKSGIQVLIESHSEHILNGLRVAVKDQLIDATDLNVLYFDKGEQRTFQTIAVDSEGGINNWPSNFFDQATTDLNYLFGI